MKVSITKLRKNAILPEYQTKHSAGMDLHAAIEKPIKLKPMERKVIPTGLAIALPDGHEAQIRARSGLAAKHGVAMANGVGTIDADYRGEIGVILINLSQEVFVIEPNMRIAQLVIARYEKIDWQEVKTLEETSRSQGGFGSTGL